MNKLIQERHNHSESFIAVKVSRRPQKLRFMVYVANEKSGLALFSTHLSHLSGSSFGNEFDVIWSGKGPYKPEVASGIIRKQFLTIYTNLIECNFVRVRKAPVLSCFVFLLGLKAGGIKSTRLYWNYETFSHLKFRPLLKSFFIVFTLT